MEASQKKRTKFFKQKTSIVGGKESEGKMKKEVIGLLIVIILLTGALFALIQKQEERIDSLERSVVMLRDMQKLTGEWLSDVHELTVDNTLRIVRLEHE